MSGLYTSRGQQGAPMRSSTVQPDRTAGTHTPASPAHGGRGAVGQGAFAHAGPVFRLTPTPALIQRFPYKYEHIRSHRKFHLVNSGAELSMTEVGDALQAPHSGYAQYEIKNKQLILKHIESDPEQGSGIGSVLMYHLGKLAQDLGMTEVLISRPAMPAVGFYEAVGAAPMDPRRAADREGEFGQHDLSEWAIERHIGHTARVTYNTDPANRLANRRFDVLSSEQQELLRGEQQAAFERLGSGARQNIIRSWVHAKAVSEQDMVTSPATMVSQAGALVTGRWQEKPLTLRTRDRLLGKNLVSLVSRAGNKYIDESGLFSSPSKQTLDAIEVLGALVDDYEKMAGAVKWYLGLGLAPDGVAVTEKLKQGSRFQTLLLAAWQEYTG